MRTHIRPFTHVCMYMHPCTRRKSVQRYNFFLIYTNFSKEKCKKSSFFCNLSRLGGKTASKIAFQFACFEKLLYLRHAPFPYRGGFLAGARLVLTQSSLRKYVRVLQNICKQRDFLPTAPSVASDYREPSSSTYRYGS